MFYRVKCMKYRNYCLIHLYKTKQKVEKYKLALNRLYLIHIVRRMCFLNLKIMNKLEAKEIIENEYNKSKQINNYDAKWLKNTAINIIDQLSLINWKYPEKNEFPKKNEQVLCIYKMKRSMKYDVRYYSEFLKDHFKGCVFSWVELSSFNKA